MPQPVKLSDKLISAAREAAQGAHRSLAAQVEHWAALGRAIDAAATPGQSALLKNTIAEPKMNPFGANASPTDVLSDLLTKLAATTSPGFSRRAQQRIRASGGPLYGSDDAFPGYIVRREPDGSLTPGQFVGSEFVPIGTSRSRRSTAKARPTAQRKRSA